MIFFYIFNFFLCLWMAKHDAKLYKQDKKPNHGKNGAVHITIGVLAGIFYGWPHFFGILAESVLVFDISYYLFRDLSPFYVTPTPRSIKDKIEQRIFGKNGVLPKLLYLIIFILCVIL